MNLLIFTHILHISSVVLYSDIANLSYTLSLAQLRIHCIIILPESYLFHLGLPPSQNHLNLVNSRYTSIARECLSDASAISTSLGPCTRHVANLFRSQQSILLVGNPIILDLIRLSHIQGLSLLPLLSHAFFTIVFFLLFPFF